MKTDKVSRVENRQHFTKTNFGMQDIVRIQPEPGFRNLLTTPPSVSNCMASMTHAMRLGSTDASFITMSEGKRFENRQTKQG